MNRQFRVKIFRELSSNKLEKSINNFLSTSLIEDIVQIEYKYIDKTNTHIAILTYKIEK